MGYYRASRWADGSRATRKSQPFPLAASRFPYQVVATTALMEVAVVSLAMQRLDRCFVSGYWLRGGLGLVHSQRVARIGCGVAVLGQVTVT